MLLFHYQTKIATKGSYVLDILSKLKDMGFEILICGTCVNFFKLKERIQIGKLSNASEIMETLTNADRIVKF